jgi:hypothetical protein
MTQPDPQDDPPELTYPGAPETVIARWMERRAPVIYGKGDVLPDLDVDLAALAATMIPLEEPVPEGRTSPYRRKLWDLRRNLAGNSELALLNANLIVHLRREFYPDHVPALFLRIWKEHGPDLMPTLPGRWLISSVITFGDIGETEAQRRIGLALNVLFSTMKLYEVERNFSGLPSSALFRRPRMASPVLPLGMTRFGFRRGGLDFNLLAPIWKEALAEPVVGPLACHLLDRLNADPSNIFRRVRRMSSAHQPAPATGDDDATDVSQGGSNGGSQGGEDETP